MAILSTLLHVLLIIGKVLLIIVLVILALIALLLLAPFCYSAHVKADKEHFQADGGVSWLLFVARVRFHLKDQEKNFEVYLLGIPVLRLLRSLKNRKKKGARSEAVSNESGGNAPLASGPEQDLIEQNLPEDAGAGGTAEAETAAMNTEQEPEMSGQQEPALKGQQKSASAEQQEPESGQPDPETAPETEQMQKPELHDRKQEARQRRAAAREQKEEAKRQRAAARAEKKADRAEKLEARKQAHRRKKADRNSGTNGTRQKISAVVAKIKWGIRLIQTEMFREAFEVAKTGGFRVLKHVMPRKISGFIRFGLNDPARTGQICGILAMLYPKMPGKLKVIPEFQEACFEADTVIKGHIFLIYFLIQGIKIILNKNVRLLIKVVRQKVPLEKVIAAERRRSGGNKNGK